jgi:hypothetical protein
MNPVLGFRLNTPQTWLLTGVASTLYIRILYFTDRAEFSTIFPIYVLLFILYFLLTRTGTTAGKILVMGLLLRLLALFAVPNLSDDFYRFFWDGLLSVGGINPFSSLPSEIAESGNIANITETLYQRLNSRDYYTIYPPFCQLIFMISAWLSQGNLYAAVVIMHVFAIAAELGSGLLIIRLLRSAGMNADNLKYYWFNPLVIIELSGNVHPESYMIFFILLAMYALEKHKSVWGAFAFSMAISSKLIPLILLPFFLKRYGIKRAIHFYVLTGCFTILAFLPLLSEAFAYGFTSSFLLYFQKFEFNASVYYLVREIGFWIAGWNIIGYAGPALAATVFFLIVALAIFEDHRKQRLPAMFIWPLFIYFALATIVHPWYITPIIAFSVFSGYRFPLIWSFMIFLSYAGYYEGGYKENTLFIWLEYLAVFGMAAWELYAKQDPHLGSRHTHAPDTLRQGRHNAS